MTGTPVQPAAGAADTGASLEQSAQEMQLEFIRLQQNTVAFTLVGLFAAVLLLGSQVAVQPQVEWVLTTALGLLGVILLAFLLNRHSFVLAAGVIITGSLAAVASVVLWGGIHAAVCLLALPVGLAALFFGAWFGLASTAVLTGLLLAAPGPLAAIDGVLRGVALVLAWGTLGMIWLTLHPMMTAVDWSWQTYRHNFRLLEQSRTVQQQLSQSLEELTAANTQLNRLNGLVNSLRHVAEEERRVKEQFVANVSHELRTPINMITGFSEMILKAPETYGERLPSNLLADLQVILRNSQHLSGLIDDVLDLSQIEAGQMALVKEWVRIDEIVDAVLVAVRPLYESKGLYLRSDLHADLPQVFCDRTRIREVLLNLLSNAGRFTNTGGVTLRVWMDDSGVLFSVTDTGPGISDADQRRLFQPFQQLDGTIRRRYGGTGLGLSISKSFIELHNGKMWVASTLGEGTSFFFRLPVESAVPLSGSVLRWINPHITPPNIERSPRASGQPVADPRPSVLVVEQGQVLQRLIRRYLPNVEVLAVSDLEAARAQMEKTPARVVLVNRPPGEQAESRSEGQLPFSTPVISCALDDSRDERLMGNLPDILVKPIARDTLLAAVERLEQPVQNILLVDDEPDAQKLFVRMLFSANRGYQVFRAGSGAQALQILERQKIDAILLDLVMPDMDGYQFLQIRQETPLLREIPVILISARDPRGQPIASRYLTVARSGGLTIQQLLDAIQAVTAILTDEPLSAHPAPPAVPPD